MLTLERRKAYDVMYRVKNKASISEKRRDYYLKNREEIKEKNRLWGQKNKDKIKKMPSKSSAFLKEKRKNDLNYAVSSNLRSRLNAAIKRGKASSSIKELGCSIEDFIKYIESKFLPGMSWDNWSKNGWHLDHIKPLVSFDLSNLEEFKLACHYTNYQPLWAVDNLRKGASHMLK